MHLLATLTAALADSVADLRTIGTIAQAFASIFAGLIAILGVPLALRQVLSLSREIRRLDGDWYRKRDAEANLNIAADYSLTHAAPSLGSEPFPHASARATADPRESRQAPDASGLHPSPQPEPGKRVLRLDLTLENVGEGTVDVLACLVAARELARQGDDVLAGGRDAQWDDLSPHYWDAPGDTLSPGLSTTKHTVYSQDALVRIKAHSRKTLARVDQILDRPGGADVYLLYRAFVAARRSSRAPADVRAWSDLQGAMLNVNAPAFRAVAGERDPLGYLATQDGWRLFLHHYANLADPQLPRLRSAADREENTIADPAERERTKVRHAAELRAYCEKTLLPAWRRYRAEYDRMAASGAGFEGLLRDGNIRKRDRAVEKFFPWAEQELWTEYFYVTLEMDE
jgi:hypothetical protein